jgi:hypothetical protein
VCALGLNEWQLGRELDLLHQADAAVYLEEDSGLLLAEHGLKLRNPFSTQFGGGLIDADIGNRANFAAPDLSIADVGLFGTITSILNNGATGVGTARQIQLMLRLNF